MDSFSAEGTLSDRIMEVSFEHPDPGGCGKGRE